MKSKTIPSFWEAYPALFTMTSTATAVRPVAGKEQQVPRLRQGWPRLKGGQPGGLAAHPLDILSQVCLGVSQLRTPVSHGISAVSSRTLVNNAGYNRLPEPVKKAARKSFSLWRENPFHPSLHFKCVNQEEKTWSVRVTLGHRALGILDGDTVTWFWIGGHQDYEREV